jgi:hypothetical protein
MKKQNLTIVSVITGIIILTIITAFRSDSSSGDTIIIRATQDMTEKDSRICVFKGNGQIERLPIGKKQDKEEDNNYDKITSTVRKYCASGYEVTTAFETPSGSNTIYSTFVLTKK